MIFSFLNINPDSSNDLLIIFTISGGAVTYEIIFLVPTMFLIWSKTFSKLYNDFVFNDDVITCFTKNLLSSNKTFFLSSISN